MISDSCVIMYILLLNSDENVPNIQDARAYKKLWTRLSISEENNCLVMLDSTRIVLPTAAVKEVVKPVSYTHLTLPTILLV